MSPSVAARPVPPLFTWPRVRFTLFVSAAFGLLLSTDSDFGPLAVVIRTVLTGFGLLLVFGWLERWPRKLPRWLARSALQLIGLVIAIPIVSSIACLLTTGSGGSDRQHLIFACLLFAPWIAVGAILRQRDAVLRAQAHGFELERSEFARQASDARLKLLQAQVEPHFLFNTLANIQALVDSGSPQASRVLNSLIAYLRAAVPQIDSPTNTLGREAELVRAYLDLMQMRMPDRLQFALHIEPAAERVTCPPMTLLTLVENAVRHGIDPSEAGGRIGIDIWLRDGRCCVRVTDTGLGMHSGGGGLGTGLTTLRERLQLAYGDAARLSLTEIQPHGVCAELEFPAREMKT